MDGVPVLKMNEMRTAAEETRLVIVLKPEALAQVQPPELRFERGQAGFFPGREFGRSHAQTPGWFTSKHGRNRIRRLLSGLAGIHYLRAVFFFAAFTTLKRRSQCLNFLRQCLSNAA